MLVGAPIALDGTLTVDNKGASSTTERGRGSTTSTPVAGSILRSLGEVHGVWNQTVDSFGDYEGPDTIVLRNSKGAIAIEFNNGKPGIVHKVGKGAVADQLTQRFAEGSVPTPSPRRAARSS